MFCFAPPSGGRSRGAGQAAPAARHFSFSGIFDKVSSSAVIKILAGVVQRQNKSMVRIRREFDSPLGLKDLIFLSVSGKILSMASKYSEHLIRLKCTVCNRVNYYSRRNKKQVERKIELKKFCEWCRKHTTHKEIKK